MRAAIVRWMERPGLFPRLAAASVWAPAGVKADYWRFRGIFRVVLPVTDVLFLWFGIVGYVLTVVSVAREAGTEWQTGWSAGLAVSALLCLVGVAFPKLWVLEAIAKVVLIGHVSVFILLQLGRILDPQVSAVAGLLVILILTPIWRVADLGATEFTPRLRAWRARRRAAREDNA